MKVGIGFGVGFAIFLEFGEVLMGVIVEDGEVQVLKKVEG